MKLRHLVLLLGLVPASLYAATEFPDGLAPLDLVRQLTGGTVYRSLPDGFPVVSLPAGTDVRLLGSMQRGASRDAILTTQNVTALYQALVAAYTAAGWTNVTGTSTAEYAVLCHDLHGLLSVTRPTQNYAGLRLTQNLAPFAPGQSCATLTSSTTSPWLTYLLGLMPALTPPPQAEPADVRVPYLLSLSPARPGNTDHTAMLNFSQELEVPDINIPGLYAHYAARLGEQAWIIDSEDTGQRSATALAFKTAAPPANVTASATQLTGSLTILHTGETQYRISFVIEAKTDANVNLGALFTVPYNVMGNGLPPLNDPQIGIRGIPAGYVGR